MNKPEKDAEPIAQTPNNDWRSKKKAVVSRVTIQLDGEVVAQIEALREEYLRADRNDRQRDAANDVSLADAPEAPAIQEKIDELTESAQETEQEFTFRSIGRHAHDELLLSHPPTDEQKKEGYGFNPDTYTPALVAAASYDPKISLQEAAEIWDDPDWNSGELLQLFFAAQRAQAEAGDIPFGRRGTGTTRRTRSK